MLRYFAWKVECSVCSKNVGWHRYWVKKSKVWICPKCVKRAGGLMEVNTDKETIEDIKARIGNK